MQYEMSRKKLRHYFGNVTYIDDKFDFCLVNDEYYDTDDGDDDGGPPLPKEADPQPIEPQKERDLSDEEKSGINLIALVKKLNEDKYSDIRLHPVAYTQDSNPETLYPQIISSPLTLIDWDLGGGKKAFPIIKQVFEQTHQLKVIVVYTASFYEAVANFSSDPDLECFPCIKKADMLQAHQCNNRSLLIIAGKQNYNILSLLDFISDLFIDECGIMPIALIDFMESAQRASDNLFGAFSEPFADLYYLQLHFSELSANCMSEAITSFMQNKLHAECSVDVHLTEELFKFQIYRLKQYTCSDDPKKKLDDCIRSMLPYFSGEEREFCAALLDVDFDCFLGCCKQAIEYSTNWTQTLHAFSPFFEAAKIKVASDRVINLIRPYIGVPLPFVIEKVADTHSTELHRKLLKELALAFRTFEEQVAPVLIQSVISKENILGNGIELIKNLKYKAYPISSLEEVLADCRGKSKSKKTAALQNILHFGDVLIKHTEEDRRQYLLCITPPCDVFRPEKTKLHVTFIHGVEIPPDQLNVRRKENSHMSALPIKNTSGKEQIQYINWLFYDIKTFDLSESEDFDDFCLWERPYMLAEPYARQISNQFISYFSRAGVDELFMKSAPSLRRLFTPQ